MFLWVSVGLGTLHSIVSICQQETYFGQFSGVAHVPVLFGAAILEKLGYRQLNSWFRCRGLWRWMTRSGWDPPDSEQLVSKSSELLDQPSPPVKGQRSAPSMDDDTEKGRPWERSKRWNSTLGETETMEESDVEVKEQPDAYRSLDDLPAWFRSREGSVQWLLQLGKDPAVLKELFGSKFVVVAKSEATETPVFTGYDNEEAVKKRVRQIWEEEGTIVVIRDQQRSCFLEPQLEVSLTQVE